MKRLSRKIKKELKKKYKRRYGINYLELGRNRLLNDFKWFYHNPFNWDMGEKLSKY